jgi:O-succinylbenzoate synthase
MIDIVAITLREIRLPLKEPFRISSGLTTERRIALLELRDGSGPVAWSECVAGELPNYSSETIDTAWLAITEWLAPRVIGKSIESPGNAFPILDEDIRGHLMAKAAIEMGIWGLEAVRLGMSLSKLIGGTRNEIDVGISLGIQGSPDALASRVTKALDEGYRKVKIKIMPGADIDFVRAARQAAGPKAPLMADANNAYTLEDAEHLAQLDELNLMMIEQPLAHDDLVRHAELQKRLQTPVCLDESIVSLDRARDMVTLGSGRIVNIKPGRVGGLASSVAIHDFCESNGVPVWCGGMLESGIGRAYNVALASLSNFVKPGDVSPSSRYWAKDIVTPEWTMTDRGTMVVPDGAGLGVDIDRDRIEDLTVRETTIS